MMFPFGHFRQFRNIRNGVRHDYLRGWVMERRFDYQQAEDLARVLKKYNIDDIIRSTEATGRVKDKESMQRSIFSKDLSRILLL